MDIKSMEIFISPDVVFHEFIFLFLSISPSEVLIDPFPTTVIPKRAPADVFEFWNNMPPYVQTDTIAVPGHDGSPIAPSEPSHLAPTCTSSRVSRKRSYQGIIIVTC